MEAMMDFVLGQKDRSTQRLDHRAHVEVISNQRALPRGGFS